MNLELQKSIKLYIREIIEGLYPPGKFSVLGFNTVNLGTYDVNIRLFGPDFGDFYIKSSAMWGDFKDRRRVDRNKGSREMAILMVKKYMELYE